MNTCNECNTEVSNSNSEFCTLCAPHMSTKESKMEDQLQAIAEIMGETKKFTPRTTVEAKCPTCRQEASVLYVGADCKACYKAEKQAVKSFTTQSGDKTLTYFKEQEAAFRDLYGDEAYCEEWKQMNSRAIGSISFKATSCGIDNNTLLTNAEMEDLSRSDAEYETTPHDLIDHSLDFGRSYTPDQVRAIAKGNETPNLSEESSDTTYKGSYISPEQKQLNLDFYMGKINKSKNLRQIAWVGKLIFGAMEGSKLNITKELKSQEQAEDFKAKGWTIEDASITNHFTIIAVTNVPTFLPAGTYKAFWAAYKAKKESLSNQGSIVMQEFQMIIENESDAIKVNRIKRSIYAADLNYNDKKQLWDLCETKKSQITAA